MSPLDHLREGLAHIAVIIGIAGLLAWAEMAALLHRMRTDPALRDGLARAEQEELSDPQRANLRVMNRQ